MSISADYFFNSDLGLAELAEAINGALGCSLAPEGEGPDLVYRCWFLGAYFGLSDAFEFENVGDLNMGDFRYNLGNTTWSGPMRASPIQVEVMAEAAFLLYLRLGIHAGILTYDGQVLLARYDLIDGKWCDRVGGKRVGFPGHLVDIKGRISDPQDRGLIYWPP